MSQLFLTEELRKISDSLNKITEADDNKNIAPPTEKINQPNVPDQADPEVANTTSDAEADNSVADIMTHEKQPGKLQGTITVKSLAQSLGMQNINLFTAAFNALRQGKLPNNQAQVRELAIAFYKLLAVDAATTSKVLNQLRRIHKAS